MKERLNLVVLGAIMGSFIYLGLGWLVFDTLLGAYTEANTTHLSGFKKTGDFSFLFLYLSCFAYALLVSFVQIHIVFNSSQQAFGFFAILGLLVACMTDFYWFATSHFYLNNTVMLIDIIAAAICVGSLGMMNFYIQKKLSKNH
jgi:hypothetical protein